jgi:hypothetical protein
MSTVAAQAPPQTVKLTATYADGIEWCHLYPDDQYYFAEWRCTQLCSGIRLITGTAAQADAPLGTRIWPNEYITLDPFTLRGTPVILRKHGTALGSSAHIQIDAEYYVGTYLATTFGATAVGSVGWHSTTLASTTVVPGGSVLGLFMDPCAYRDDEGYNWLNSTTPFHRTLCKQLTVEYDGTKIVDEGTPSTSLWTNRSTVTYADGAVSNRWNVNFPQGPIKTGTRWGRRSIRSVKANPFGEACLVQSVDWLKGLRLLFTSDRFRTFDCVDVGNIGAADGWMEWGSCDWYPRCSGWKAFYLSTKQLYMRPMDHTHAWTGTAQEIGATGHIFQAIGTGTVFTKELYNLEPSHWQANFHQFYGPTVICDAGSMGTVYGSATLCGTPVTSTAYFSSYLIRAFGELFDWAEAGTATHAAGYVGQSGFNDRGMDIANPGYWPLGYCPTYLHPALGLRLECQNVSGTACLGSLETTAGAIVDSFGSALMLDAVFKLYPDDSLWYGLRDDNIYESEDGFHWTAINRVPDWYRL